MIINSGFDSFFQKTKSALEEFQGSPIKKDGKILKFLAKQMGARNEHVLKTQFESEGKETENKKQVFVIQQIELEPEFHSDTLNIERLSVKLASSEMEFDEICRDLVRSSIPDHDGAKDDILGLADIESELDEDDELYDKDIFEVIDWVFENFDTHYLIGERFIGELTYNRVRFEVETQYIKIA